MGLLISRFKRKKTTREVLDKLEKDISSIEKYRTNTEQTQRRIVGQLILYSVGAYVLAAALFYFYWFPNTFREQCICIAPLLLFPIIVLLLKRIVTFYYSRKITQNEQKLLNLRAEKKKILEEVMDKETYKNARAILELFAPEQLRTKGLESSRTPDKSFTEKSFLMTGLRSNPPATPRATPVRPMLPSGPAPTELRRRTLPAELGQSGANIRLSSTLAAESFTNFQATPQRVQVPSGTPMPMHRASVNGQGFISDYRPPGPPLPRPVLPRERSYLDRVVEYLVGDGPSNRFALVCSSCQSHNGMALKEEFEYLPFRCCYCHYFNPARKQRPQAPRLSPISGLKSHSAMQLSGTAFNKKNDETSDSEKCSGSESSSDEDEDSGPELQPLETTESEVEGDKGGKTNEAVDVANIKDKTDTTLNEEAEEFLKSLESGNREKDAEEPTNETSPTNEGPP